MGAQGVGYQSVVVDSLVNPPLLEEGGQVFCFDSLHMHIGNIPDTDAPRVCTFPFRNISGRKVRITKISTSCGCTAAAFSSETLVPGTESTVTLVYDPKNRIGTVETYAFVYTDVSDKHPVARLVLTGEVICSDRVELSSCRDGSAAHETQTGRLFGNDLRHSSFRTYFVRQYRKETFEAFCTDASPVCCFSYGTGSYTAGTGSGRGNHGRW